MVKRYVSKDTELTDEEPQLNEENEETVRKRDILILRRVRARMHRTQRNIVKLHDNLRFLKRCAINCLDILDSAVDIIEHEGQETGRMVQMVEEPSGHSSSRRNRGLGRRATTMQLRSLLEDINVDDITQDIENINSSIAGAGAIFIEEENSNLQSSS